MAEDQESNVQSAEGRRELFGRGVLRKHEVMINE